jgi:hypothetical protein
MRTSKAPRISAIVPLATMRPLSRIANRSQTASTSLSRCEFKKHGRTARARIANDSAHVGAADGIERGGRLVEDQQFGLADQRHAEPEPLLHALRERADLVALAPGQPDDLEHARDLGLARATRRPRAPAWKASTSGAVSQS